MRRSRRADTARIRESLQAALAEVPSADDDRIIRAAMAVIDAMLRVSYFQTAEDGRAKPFLAFKLDSRKLEMLPAPKPLYEIFVYSPEVEGVHLRFGRIARGGIRWSDRPEDFRTEILSLVKAQQVKNAVIVPVGAKGGFYPKRLPQGGTRDQIQAAGISAYKTFVGALLDLTDNIGPDGRVIPPARVHRHDGDDPYLVVAADKGTATFSDIANGLAEGARLLARRCLRVGRFARLRPQEDGHHRARRMGSGEAPFPRDGTRHADDAVHGRRRGGHVG